MKKYTANFKTIRNNKVIVINTLEPIDAAYLAGYVDGDGSIIAQLVKRDDYRYKFQIKISIIFHQKTKRN